MNLTNTTKVFISYSWKPASNKEKVLKMAERLRADGIDVVLDVWDLKEGHDKYAFMEQMVTAPEISKVLIICNKDYVIKSDGRQGGVGAESTIISSDVYNQADQTKFVPVVFEKSNGDVPYLPVFLKTRIYIDLATDISYEVEYDKLLRNLYNKPMLTKPPIGAMPSYLKEEIPKFLPTAHKVAAIKDAIIYERRHKKALMIDYLELVMQTIKENNIDPLTNTDLERDERVLDALESLRPLRNDFIEFADILLKYSDDIDSEMVISFWSALLEYKIDLKNNSSASIWTHDHIFILVHELYLYIVAIYIKYKRFKELGLFVTENYVITTSRRNEVLSYSSFYHHSDVLDRRNERLRLSKISMSFNLIRERIDGDIVSIDDLWQADMLLFYLPHVNKNINKGTNRFVSWFPALSVKDSWGALPIFAKAIKKSFFEDVKYLLGVDTKEQLVQLCDEAKESATINIFHYNIPPINEAFGLQALATVG